MTMTGEERIAAPRERVWEALNDPAVLRRCIPGCRSLDKEGEDRLIAAVGIRIGPINARLPGRLVIPEVDAPDGYRLTGGATVRLSGEGAETLLAYDVGAQVGGRLAQLGGAVIDATARQLAGAFFRKSGELVSAPPSAAAAPAAPTMAAAWLFLVVAAAVAGFLIGHAVGGLPDRAALAIELPILAVAAAGFEVGRRAAAVR